MGASIAAARVVTPDATLSPGWVECSDGVIAGVHPGIPDGGTGPGFDLLAPGFVDIQVNGIGAVDVAGAQGDDWAALDASLVAQGVTAWCPTLVTQPRSAYADPLVRIASAAARGGLRPAILGAHLEGPFLGGAPGAHNRDWLAPIDGQWLDSLPPIVRLVTLAPELDGAGAAIRALRTRGVVVSLGHSTASYETALEGIGAGAGLVTHCFNGMGPLHHRQPGLLGAALTDDRVRVSLIADLVHVHPAAITLAFRAKSGGGVVLVTDSVAWEAAPHVTLEGGAPRLGDGTLAGSCLAMDVAVANVVRHGRVGLEDAIRAAATNPADLLGASDRGRIAVGARADLVALGLTPGGGWRAEATFIAGEQVFALR